MTSRRSTDHHRGEGEKAHHHQAGPSGRRSRLWHALKPHSHDAAGRFDDVLTRSRMGIRVSLFGLAALLGTAGVQLVVALVTGSVALMADTVHNVSDAFTAIPLAIAFLLSRRAASRRFTHGLGRLEDFVGLLIVAAMAATAVYTAYLAVHRLLHPAPVSSIWAVAVAGLVGALGNEAVAGYRIRVGRRIGAAALVADGYHARTDALTSLSVVLGAVGVSAGLAWSDPVVGLVIAVVILVAAWKSGVEVVRRLLDGVDPGLVETARLAAGAGPQVLGVSDVRMRWVGHELRAEVDVEVPGEVSLQTAHDAAHAVEARVREALPHCGRVTVHACPAGLPLGGSVTAQPGPPRSS
jgi:cation diffusion facilitator family transporter